MNPPKEALDLYERCVRWCSSNEVPINCIRIYYPIEIQIREFIRCREIICFNGKQWRRRRNPDRKGVMVGWEFRSKDEARMCGLAKKGWFCPRLHPLEQVTECCDDSSYSARQPR